MPNDNRTAKSTLMHLLRRARENPAVPTRRGSPVPIRSDQGPYPRQVLHARPLIVRCDIWA